LGCAPWPSQRRTQESAPAHPAGPLSLQIGKSLAIVFHFSYNTCVKKALLLIQFLLLVPLPSAFALEPAGARIQSLGGAGVALPAETAAIYWNPAGIYYQDRLAVDMTLQFDKWEWPGNWGFSYLNYSHSARRGAGLGIYRMFIEAPADSLEDSDALATLLSTVYRSPVGLPLGLSLKYVNENWQGEGRKSYFTADVGSMLALGSFHLGANFQSVTQPKSRIYPYQVLLGLSWIWEQKATLACQATVHDWNDLEHLDEADLRAGLEIAPFSVLALQAGWRDVPGEKYWTGGFTLGAREGSGQLHFAYHWHPSGDIDDRFFVGYNYSP